MKETGGRWRKGVVGGRGGEGRGGGRRTVIKMRTEEKAHVRSKQKKMLAYKELRTV